jgi:hypothetical protein
VVCWGCGAPRRNTASMSSGVIHGPTLMTEGSGRCLWCGSLFERPNDRGKTQRFCRPPFRRALDAPGRRWVAGALGSGALRPRELPSLRGWPLVSVRVLSLRHVPLTFQHRAPAEAHSPWFSYHRRQWQRLGWGPGISGLLPRESGGQNWLDARCMRELSLSPGTRPPARD